MTPTDSFFSGSRYAIFGARARGRMQGPVLIGALNKAGKRAVAVESAGGPVKGAEVAASLKEAGQVDGVVLLPPAPWNSESVEFTSDAVRQCKEAGVKQLWIYTAGSPDAAVEIAAKEGLDPCAGRCPCLYIQGAGFPHGLHRGLLKLTHQL